MGVTVMVERKLPVFGTKHFPFWFQEVHDKFCKKHAEILNQEPYPEQPIFLQGTGKIRTPKHVQFIICTVDIPDKPPFSDLINRRSEFEETFTALDFTVEVCEVSSSSDLSKALSRDARFRVVFVHGDLRNGLQCSDDDWVSWKEMVNSVGLTGLMVILSCDSHDAIIEDPDDEFDLGCRLPDELFPRSEGCERKVNALITVTGQSHHFTFRFRDNTHFEIQRMATLLELCDQHDFRTAVSLWNAEIEQNLDPVVAKSIRGHERIQAYDGKICGTASE